MSAKIQSEYEKDFYAWALHNAALIREGKLAEVDLEHVAEEIESMGNSNKRELASRLAVLIAHILKWQFQPTRRSTSWKLTIKVQRISTIRLLKQSPSLKYEINSTLEDAYEEAIVMAANETGLDESSFPNKCPFSLEQCLDHEFFPG